jgi:hypothetical protein
LLDVNPGGWLGLFSVLYGDAQQQADLRRQGDQMEAERRHQELMAEIEASSRRREFRAESEASARQTPDEAEDEPESDAQHAAEKVVYWGPFAQIARLRLPNLSNRPLPADAQALRSEIDPPNLVVVGGTDNDARTCARAVQQRLGGRMVESKLAGLSMGDLAAVATTLEANDVLFIPSFDGASAGAVNVLVLLQDLSPDDATPEASASRSIPVVIGHGPTARTLNLSVHPYFLVAHTRTGTVPEPLTAWGGQVVAPGDGKICPQCGEEVKAKALLCRFCRYEFGSVPPPSQPDPIFGGRVGQTSSKKARTSGGRSRG